MHFTVDITSMSLVKVPLEYSQIFQDFWSHLLFLRKFKRFKAHSFSKFCQKEIQFFFQAQPPKIELKIILNKKLTEYFKAIGATLVCAGIRSFVVK